MLENIFVLQKSITNNISGESLSNFLRTTKTREEYTESGKGKEEFISEMVNEGKISIEELNDFLYKELFYGKHKNNYIRKFSSSEVNLESEQEIVAAIEKRFKIKGSNTNYIATNYFSPGEEKEELPLFKIKKDSLGKIKKIHFIFSEKVKIYDGESKITEHSYFPVEVNIDKKIMITRAARKEKMVNDTQKYEVLQEKYSQIVIELLGLTTEIYTNHKEIVYKIMVHLVNQIFAKMCENKPKGIKPLVKESCAAIINELNIENFDIKKEQSNIFDIEGNINRLIDHMLISNILYKVDINEKLSGVDGVITYLRFNDGTNLQAILHGENYQKAIYDSEAFMGLRSTIDNVQEIREANILWYKDKNVIRVKYETSSPQYLLIFFYKLFDKGDFEYALRKYEELESGNISKIQEMDKEYSNSVAK